MATTPALVTLIVGAEPTLQQRELEAVVAAIRADLPDVEVATQVATELERLPEMRTQSLFGGSTCVIILDARNANSALTEELGVYVASPDPEARLVLVMDKAPRGKGFHTTVQQGAKTDSATYDHRSVSPPPDFRTDDWIRIVKDEFSRHGKQAGQQVLELVLERAGTEVTAIVTKVGQVCGAAAGARVSEADVERVLEGYGRQSGFKVADACVDRDPAGALTALRGALEAGDEPVMLLGGLVHRFRSLLQVRAGKSPTDIGMSPFQHKRLLGLAKRNFGPGELGRCHERLARADVDLKGSPLPSEVVLELAVLDVATAAGRQ